GERRHTNEMHLRAETLLDGITGIAGIAGTTFGTGCENKRAGHCLSSLFAFEFGQPFSHLFGSEALKVVFSARGEGLQGSATRVLAKQRRFSTVRNSCVNGGGLCTG